MTPPSQSLLLPHPDLFLGVPKGCDFEPPCFSVSAPLVLLSHLLALGHSADSSQLQTHICNCPPDISNRTSNSAPPAVPPSQQPLHPKACTPRFFPTPRVQSAWTSCRSGSFYGSWETLIATELDFKKLITWSTKIWRREREMGEIISTLKNIYRGNLYYLKLINQDKKITI